MSDRIKLSHTSDLVIESTDDYSLVKFKNGKMYLLAYANTKQFDTAEYGGHIYVKPHIREDKKLVVADDLTPTLQRVIDILKDVQYLYDAEEISTLIKELDSASVVQSPEPQASDLEVVEETDGG